MYFMRARWQPQHCLLAVGSCTGDQPAAERELKPVHDGVARDRSTHAGTIPVICRRASRWPGQEAGDGLVRNPFATHDATR